MNKGLSINTSKLFKLKKWFTILETAKQLSIVFGEEVNESDVYRLALDGHLRLSVNFVNHAEEKRGEKMIPFDEWKEKFIESTSWDALEAIPFINETIYFTSPEFDHHF